MKETSPLIITISRQLGSGGAYIGQQLAKHLNISYIDREILSQAAEQLSVLEEDLEARDEKINSIWKSILQSYAFYEPDTFVPPQIYTPTDRQLFKTEAEIMEHIAKERSAIIIGRCGGYILRNFSNHVKIFLYGDTDFRKKRAQEVYNISSDEAEKMIQQSDAERWRYHHKLTGREWTDTRQYDISVDTSKIGIDKGLELIIKYLELI